MKITPISNEGFRATGKSRTKVNALSKSIEVRQLGLRKWVPVRVISGKTIPVTIIDSPMDQRLHYKHKGDEARTLGEKFKYHQLFFEECFLTADYRGLPL